MKIAIEFRKLDIVKVNFFKLVFRNLRRRVKIQNQI